MQRVNDELPRPIAAAQQLVVTAAAPNVHGDVHSILAPKRQSSERCRQSSRNCRHQSLLCRGHMASASQGRLTGEVRTRIVSEWFHQSLRKCCDQALPLSSYWPQQQRNARQRPGRRGIKGERTRIISEWSHQSLRNCRDQSLLRRIHEPALKPVMSIVTTRSFVAIAGRMLSSLMSGLVIQASGSSQNTQSCSSMTCTEECSMVFDAGVLSGVVSRTKRLSDAHRWARCEWLTLVVAHLHEGRREPYHGISAATCPVLR